jgi:hypothetical protein
MSEFNSADQELAASVVTSYASWLLDAISELKKEEPHAWTKAQLAAIMQFWKLVLEDDLQDEFTEQSEAQLEGIQAFLQKLG